MLESDQKRLHPDLVRVLAACVALALWLYGRPYQGIYHDARLYALQAMARLHPSSLGHDVFLAFVSQDTFTFFSPAYAFVIGLLGLESAARWLTLAGHLWWLAAYFAIARSLVGTDKAWLAMIIVAALPGYYGAWEVFRFAEPFLTPRIFAEAAVLTAILAALHGRILTSVTLVGVAMAAHPLMAAGGALVVATVLLPAGKRWLVPCTVIAGLALSCLVALIWPFYPLTKFDAEWFELVRTRAPFLFVQDWNEDGWRAVLWSLGATFLLGSTWPPGNARILFRTSSMIGLLGLLITIVGASIFKIVLLAQGQGWRWAWISGALLAIAAVRGVPLAWRSGPVARSALMLLGSGWLTVGWPSVALVASALLIWELRVKPVNESVARALLTTSYAVFIACAISWIGLHPGIPDILAGGIGDEPLRLPALILGNDGVLPVAIGTLAFMALRTWTRPLLLAPATASIAVAVISTFYFFTSVRQTDYAAADQETLQTWQRVVPVSSEMLWTHDPAAAWFVLTRRNYISSDQTAGAVFSRPAAMEMRRRAVEAKAIVSPSLAFGAMWGARIWEVTTRSIKEVCRNPELDFVASRQWMPLFQPVPPLLLPDRVTGVAEPVYLYDCTHLSSTS